MSNAMVEDCPIPDTIKDSKSGCIYKKGKFYGKGGFAKCYELINSSTQNTFAGKIVSKQLLAKSNQREKMVQEIEIHRGLNHKHVVGFNSFFEDSNFVYIILELCKKRSMMELHKRRSALTEPEVRYFMRQLLDGVCYLHGKSIIHRDLKLGNLFLNDRLELKIGDFGLAARIEYSGQRKRTLCGTPNYIAPEVLTKKGHSFEVDIWSLGCIMYTLLVGKPPFETHTLKETYSKIKRCEYMLPSDMNSSAALMINQMLQPDPLKRPNIQNLIDMEFIKTGYCPKELPASCLTVAPRFDSIKDSRVPLKEVFNNRNHVDGESKQTPRASIHTGGCMPLVASSVSAQCQLYMKQLHFSLKKLLRKKIITLSELDPLHEEISDPAAQPFVWISKWVDYSDKYGFGYQLVDDGVGVMYNDCTRLVILSNNRNVHYIERDGTEAYYIMGSTPPELNKKMKLMAYFRKYMHDHLMKAGASVSLKESDSLSRIPYLNMWNRSSSGVIMQLTNGTIQINFVDHTKIIMCPLMNAVTYIDMQKNFFTYRFSTIEEKGCVKGLHTALQYALRKLTTFIEQKTPMPPSARIPTPPSVPH